MRPRLLAPVPSRAAAALLALVLGGLAIASPDGRAAASTPVGSPWQEGRFHTGCDPGPFTEPPAPDDVAPRQPVLQEAPESASLEVDLTSADARRPLLGSGFNLEHALWSCPSFQPLLGRELLDPFRPALLRIDTGLLPVAPPHLLAAELGPSVYGSVLGSAPYTASWGLFQQLDRFGAQLLLGVWGGPGQFTDDGTRRGLLAPEHYDDYVGYVESLVEFVVRQQGAHPWAVTIANEPEGGDGNRIPPAGLAYIAHQLALRLAPYGVKLYGPDTASAEYAMEYLPLLLGDPVVADQLAFVGFHEYFPNPEVASLVDYVRALRPDLPVVITEYTSYSYGDLDTGQEASSALDFTLEVADTVLAHYRHGADAALYWDAVDYLQPGHDAITKWGMLRSPAEGFARREWYHGLRQLLPYLQPGARVLSTRQQGGDDVGVLAVRTADRGLALFLVNQGDTSVDLSLAVTGRGSAQLASLAVTRTDAREAAALTGELRLDEGTGWIVLPGRSITTLAAPSGATDDIVLPLRARPH